MEDIITYQAWINKYKERHAVSIQRAVNKREDRRLRNLTNKANGGFQCLKHVCSLDQPKYQPETI